MGPTRDVMEPRIGEGLARYRAPVECYLVTASRLLDGPVRGLVRWLDAGGAVAASPVA